MVQLVSSSGTVTKTYRYDAFGGEYTPDANDTNYFRYCGQYFDTESGTYYLRARYYDPALGRFTSEDPANAGLNWYTYCNCNPISYIDPFGLDAILLYDNDGMGDTALLLQYNGGWYYFFFGADAVIWTYIGKELPDTLDAFNETQYSLRAYTDSVYLTGDYTNTAEYCISLVAKYFNESLSKGDYTNYNYNLLFNNCAVICRIALQQSEDFIYIPSCIASLIIPRYFYYDFALPPFIVPGAMLVIES